MYAHGWRVWMALSASERIDMSEFWRTIIWQQFGAAIDMLDNAIRACPDALWRSSVWEDPTDAPEYTEFWFVAYHTISWANRYLSAARDEFTPPAPFVVGRLPERPYTKEEVVWYLDFCRRKAQATFEAMTDEKAGQPYEFPWGGEMSFAELQLYNMRHIQEHAAQLSLHLGQRDVAAPDWVSRAGVVE